MNQLWKYKSLRNFLYLLWLHTFFFKAKNSNLVIFAHHIPLESIFFFFHFKKDILLPISKLDHTQIKGHNNSENKLVEF